MADITKNPIFTDEAAARAYLEKLRWPDGVVCAHCGAYGDYISPVKKTETRRKPTDEGKRHKPARAGRYYCKSCSETFTVTVGTIMEDSHVPLNKWVYAFRLMLASKKGISAHQMHRMLGVTYKTAWFMGHRIREALRQGGLSPMGGGGGVVEIDETLYGRTATHPKGRARDRRAIGGVHMNVVLSLVERGGNVRSYHVAGSTVSEVIPIVQTNVSKEAATMTDRSSLYKKRLRRHFASHDSVDHTKKEYARYELGRVTIHTNTVEGYFALFKRGMRGIYQHCSEKHLHRYLAEFDFRYNNRVALGVEDAERTDRALRGIVGKRLTYRRTGGDQRGSDHPQS